MNDVIEKDDSKIDKLLDLQETYTELAPEPEPSSVIEKDDLKLDDLLDLQSMAIAEPEPSSIEEKYEEELAFQQIAESIISRLSSQNPIVEYEEDEEEDYEDW